MKPRCQPKCARMVRIGHWSLRMLTGPPEKKAFVLWQCQKCKRTEGRKT